jgi:hypothetical protein
MSCESPFSLGETIGEEHSYNVQIGGPATIPGYTVPGWELCLLGWNPAHIQWGTCCLGGCVCNTWDWCQCCTQNNHCDVGWDSGSHYWYDCTQIAPVVLWPTIDIDASMACVLTITVDDGVEITAEPPTAPIPTISLSISDIYITFGFGLYGSNITKSFPLPITVEVDINDGIPSIIIPLGPPVSSQSTVNLGPFGTFTIDISLTFSLLFCLEPIPPQGWVNILVTVGIDGTYSIDGNDTAIDETASLAFPIISLEEGD